MGNTLNVVEEGSIQCVCGGPVTLKSSAVGQTIGGKKPLHLIDLLGASVACTRSPKQNPCTVVAAISDASTETNVGAKGKTFLLRVDGCKTDKGRGLVLVAPGQGTAKTLSIPSVENEDIKEDEQSNIEEKEDDELIFKEKYALYFLRKSENIYKALRPSRGFRNASDTILNNNSILEVEAIHTHTLAFVYVFQEGQEYKEYKIISRGTLYAETINDILFKNTKTDMVRREIPLETHNKVDIYYSNIKITDEEEIKKLKKTTVNPKSPSNKNFYIKDIGSINNKQDITTLDIETQKKYIPRKDGKQKRKDIVVCIEDIIGEIEDMYERYRVNYNLSFAQNHEILEKVKHQNMYPYTVANMVDYFYIDPQEETKQIKDLKN
jgi:hypothetical protein